MEVPGPGYHGFPLPRKKGQALLHHQWGLPWGHFLRGWSNHRKMCPKSGCPTLMSLESCSFCLWGINIDIIYYFVKKQNAKNNHMLTLAQVYRTWIVPSSVLVCGSVLSHNICVFRSAIFISIHPWTWMNGCDNCQENPAGYESHFMDVTVNIVFLWSWVHNGY